MELVDAGSVVGPAGSTPVTLALGATAPGETGKAVRLTSGAGVAFSVHAVNARPAITTETNTNRDAILCPVFLRLVLAGDIPRGQILIDLVKTAELIMFIFLIRNQVARNTPDSMFSNCVCDFSIHANFGVLIKDGGFFSSCNCFGDVKKLNCLALFHVPIIGVGDFYFNQREVGVGHACGKPCLCHL